MEKPDLETLLKLVHTQYVSLSNPNWAFKWRFWENRPYREVEARLHDQFDVRDNTDTNYDVSFQYLLRRPEGLDWQWVLELSLLGPYAVLLRAQTVDPPVISDSASGEREQWIVQLLDEQDISLLDQAELEYPIKLPTTIAEEGHVYLYHALIADVAILPWKTALNNWWPNPDGGTRRYQTLDNAASTDS